MASTRRTGSGRLRDGRACVLISTLLSLAWPAIAHAQADAHRGLDPRLQITQYVHDAWSTADGLPQNSVYAITQTPDGYVWIGTQEGLARFDGVEFEVYNRARLEGLGSNEIWALQRDGQGGLWVGTSGGGLVRLKDGAAHTYSTPEGLTSDLVKALHVDQAGRLWVGTIGGGACRLEEGSFQCLTREDGLVDDIVLAIAESADGALWFGTSAGLSRLEGGAFTNYTAQDGLPGEVIRALYPAAGGIWIGTDHGLARWQDGTLQALSPPPGRCGDVISALFEDPAQALWVGTLDGGVCRLYRGRYAAFTAEDGLRHDQIRSFYQGREGGLWIGTDGGGLHRLGSGPFIPLTTAEGLSGDVVASVLETRDGAMWIGTDGNGLNRLQDGVVTRYRTSDGLPSDYVYALHEGRSGALWVGMLEGGLCRFEEERFRCFGTADGLPSENLWSIYEDRAGRLWLGTDAGLGLKDGDAFRVLTTEDGLSADWITALHEDRSGALWIGTLGGGLNRRRPDGTIDVFSVEDGLSSNFILALHEDAEGALWVGTKEGGLCRRADGAFRCFTSRDGLPNDNVLQILEDADGHLWLASLSGITRVSKEDLQAFAQGKTDTIESRVFGLADGLKSREFNGGTQPSAWRTRDGRLWFASMRGVAVVDPAVVGASAPAPATLIESVRVNEQPVGRLQATALPPGSSDIQFDYTAPSFVAPGRMAFRYKLVGYDDEWVAAGTRRTAYYTNLPPGPYQFRVQARNSGDGWSEEGAVAAFSIRPFFYQTSWFYLLCGLVLLAGGVGAHVGRTRYLRRREQALQQRVDEQTVQLRERERELEVQYEQQLVLTEQVRTLASELTLAEQQERRRISQILHDDLQQLLYGVQMQFFFLLSDLTPEDEALKDQLDQMYQMLDQAITTTRQLTVDLSPLVLNGEGLVEAIQWLQTFMDEVHGLEVEVVSHGTIYPPTDDMRVLLFQLVRELLFNVVKHAGVKRATVELEETDHRLTIHVIDEGAGFDVGAQAPGASGGGFGLYSVRERLGLFGGELRADSAPGQGTRMTITVPLRIGEPA